MSTAGPTHSFPPPYPASQATVGRRPRGRLRWFPWALLALALVWVITDGKNEIGRWYYAAALQASATGQSELALDRLQRAIDWAPGDFRPYLALGHWKLADKDYAGALAEYDRAWKCGGDRYEILTAHSVALQHLGRHAEAVADWERIERLTRTPSLVFRKSWYNPRRASDLNGLAYAQALGKIDLDAALERVNAALELMPPEPSRANVLETRAFIYCQQGEYQRSVDEMNGAFDDILRVRAMVKQLRAQGKMTQAEMLAESLAFPPSSLAVFYYHRSLAYAGLGKTREAEADRARVRELIGHDADDHLF
jgi:tetratricopeptide (TPR) repeat protein